MRNSKSINLVFKYDLHAFKRILEQQKSYLYLLKWGNGVGFPEGPDH